MSLFKSKIELTPEQEKQKDFIELILSKPSSVIEVNPTNMAYYIINADVEVEVDSNGIQIDGDCFSYSRRLPSGVIDLFKTLCKTEATKRRNERRDNKTQKTLEKLNVVKESL